MVVGTRKLGSLMCLSVFLKSANNTKKAEYGKARGELREKQQDLTQVNEEVKKNRTEFVKLVQSLQWKGDRNVSTEAAKEYRTSN